MRQLRDGKSTTEKSAKINRQRKVKSLAKGFSLT
jgi:hypothetical protein